MTAPPDDQHRRSNQAANALVAVMRPVTGWTAARVTFEVQSERVVLLKLVVQPLNVEGHFDAYGLGAVAEALTALWRRAGPEPWQRGSLVVYRALNKEQLVETWGTIQLAD